MTRTTPEMIPAPKTENWLDGKCVFAESEIQFKADTGIPSEGYRIEISPEGVTVASSNAAGAFYAMKTLQQASVRESDGRRSCRCGRVADWPSFKWRGMLLDEGRHFFGKETVKSLLDRLADYKFNVFHWHLADDQGWRLAIDRFPELARYGSVRPESAVHGCRGNPEDYRGNGQPYGPFFYTASDVREILSYAKERFITVVPEIEVPGHVRALLAAHPEFACREGLARAPRTVYGVESDVLCAGNDDAIRFMEQVFDEVCALFPGEFVHIGGDECPKDRWRECPKCQSRIKALGLDGENGLQAWVTRHFADYLAKKGRRAIGWDEVLDGDPGQGVAVQAWHGPEDVARAAAAGHDVIASPFRLTYFSMPQGVEDDPFTYLAPAARLPLEAVYGFDPASGVSEEAKGRVLGSECCVWSECVWNEYDLAFKLWPRALAFAEALWSAPADPRDFAGFSRRAEKERRRLISLGVNCAPLR